MKILIVGAGAVGQVYGWHLAQAGHEVAALGRPNQLDAARAGFVLTSLGDAEERELGRWHPKDFYSEASEVSGAWDQVWLCVSTHALDEEWLGALAERTASAVVISLQPGAGVRERLGQFWPRQAIIRGVIGMISAGRKGPVGTRGIYGAEFVFPLGVKSQFSGAEPAQVRAVVRALRDGGVPARGVQDADLVLAWGSGLLMPNIVTLESVEWSISSLASCRSASLAARAVREAHTLVSRRHQARRPWWSHLLYGPLLIVAWRVGRRLMGFDLEVYLRQHFLKVRPQTHQMIARYLRDSDEYGVSVPALRELDGLVFAP